jgi:DNA-directed DNA polymerase III PolC
MYINCKTYFSFKYGTFGTEELVATAAAHGVRALALTNINNTCDTWDFVDFCNEQGIKPVAGVEVRNNHQLLYILLARNNAGFLFINRFLSAHLQSNTAFPARPVQNANTYIIYPLSNVPSDDLHDNERIGIQLTELNSLYHAHQQLPRSRMIIRQPVTFQNKKMFNAHRLLRAIDRNIILSKQQLPDVAGEHETFLEPAILLSHFRLHPDLVTNTLKLIDDCNLTIDFHSDKTKKIYSSTKEDDKVLLEKLAYDGMRRRYGSNDRKALDRVQKELRIIDELGFNAYFLITWDIIRYAQHRDFFYIGRGSGGNSIVAYCLEITDVDPIELDLYFERFLNPFRSVPPDFDIDFSWKDRDELTDYIFKRYGKDHVSLLGTYSTFQTRAILRELGKVFGLPKDEIDALSEKNAGTDHIKKQILSYANLIKGFPSHLSVHAGGVLISDEPIFQYTATELPPKGFATSQIDMFMAEKIGLYKLDILSQRGLGHIKETISLVQENRGVAVNIHDIEKFKRDPAIADQIRRADTIGCFYIESPGMRQLLQKLKCEDYITLVAASSIIRPGVSQSGMMRQYIQRYHNPNGFEYLHPKMKELLEETYGVMVYQEDVIKVAHHFAGLDMAEADVLRRAMSGKYRSRKQFEAIREKFFTNCKSRGYPDEITKEVWRQIESFGGYSFSKAHSASFAVESYQSLFLKTYFPKEFMVAVINNFGGFYNRELYFHELKKTGAEIILPCINNSRYLTHISGEVVHMGFVHIEGLEESLVQSMIIERNLKGPYIHLQDFIQRVAPPLEQLNILIRIGGFRFTGKSKKELLWEANFLRKRTDTTATNVGLFVQEPVAFHLPALTNHPLDDAMDEIELLGFPLCNPFELVADNPLKYTDARDIPNHINKDVQVLGYLVTTKPVNTVNNETMFFGTFIDRNGDWIDTVHFPPVLTRHPLSGKGFYRIIGKVVEEFGVYSIEVTYSSKIGIKDRTEAPNILPRNIGNGISPTSGIAVQ